MWELKNVSAFDHSFTSKSCKKRDFFVFHGFPEATSFKQFIRNYSHFIATLRKKLKNAADPMKELEKMFDKKSVLNESAKIRINV